MDYNSLVIGGGNTAGTGAFISVIPLSDLSNVVAAAVDPASPDLVNVIATDHTVVTGKKWIKIPLDLDDNELTSESVGDYLGAGGKLSLKGFIPGFDKTINGTLIGLKNEPLLIVVPLMDGKQLQMGSELLYAKMKTSFTSGKVSGTQRGYNAELTSYGDVAIYEGAISYEAAV